MAPGDDLELAKAGIEQLGETGREMLRLASESSVASEVGGLLTDELRFQRFKRQIKIVKRAERLVDDAGLSPRAVPLKTLAPILAWGSVEEDDDMSSRWANLLASAGSATSSGFHVSYPELLRQLEPLEASIIDALFALEKNGRPVDPRAWRLKSGAWRTLPQVIAAMGRPEEELVTIDVRNLQNLARLALCRVRGDDGFGSRGMRRSAADQAALDSNSDLFGVPVGPKIGLTPLGLEFSVVCQTPDTLR